MRFCATILSPASSSLALTLPVRLRVVASGLMIESVRVTAIGVLLLAPLLMMSGRPAPARPYHESIAGGKRISSQPPCPAAESCRFMTAETGSGNGSALLSADRRARHMGASEQPGRAPGQPSAAPPAPISLELFWPAD